MPAVKRGFDGVHTLQKRDSNNYSPGSGTFLPTHGQNKGWFALFALLGAAMVLATIWFFFWAKNGGFIWRKGDWEEYKSTVLRRKGKDGKTLSNATPRTDLGQKSIAGTFSARGHEEMSEVTRHAKARPRQHDSASRKHEATREDAERTKREKREKREHPDADVRAYRREKPARVGGMNRAADGSNFDWTNTDRSELSSNVTSLYGSEVNLRRESRPQPELERKKGFFKDKMEQVQAKKAEKEKEKGKIARAKARAKDAKKQEKENKRSAGRVNKASTPQKQEKSERPTRRYSFSEVASTVADSTANSGSNNITRESYYHEYRPQPPQPTARVDRNASPRHSSRASHTSSHTSTPTRSRRSSPRKPSGYSRHPGAFDVASEAGTSDTGTKVYTHHIPHLSQNYTIPEGGFRRGMPSSYGRRDSLSGSDVD